MKVIIEGGGFPAFWYGLGYGSNLVKHIRPTVIGGYSAGSLAAAIIVCSDLTVSEVVEVYGGTLSFNRCGGIAKFVTSMMDNVMPPDAHIRANDKLAVVMCDPNNNYKCKVISKWNSRDELIKSLVASCYIPCMMDIECFKLADETYKCQDAVFSRNLPDVLDCFHIVVSYRPYMGLDLGRLCRNLNLPSHDKTLSLLAEGEKDCEIQVTKIYKDELHYI